MTSSSSPATSFHSASSYLAESILNNHVPPDLAPEDIASFSPVADRQSIVNALADTEGAIRKIEVSLSNVPADCKEKLADAYYQNGTFSREVDGMGNLMTGVDWFQSVKNQALNYGERAIVLSSGSTVNFRLRQMNTTLLKMISIRLCRPETQRRQL